MLSSYCNKKGVRFAIVIIGNQDILAVCVSFSCQLKYAIINIIYPPDTLSKLKRSIEKMADDKYLIFRLTSSLLSE